jgi:hypothetical protein
MMPGVLRWATVFLLIPIFAHAQRPASKLTNHDVTDLVSLGFSDEVIIDKIRATDSAEFDTNVSPQELKAAKVSDAVIRAMINTLTTALPAAGALATFPSSRKAITHPHEESMQDRSAAREHSLQFTVWCQRAGSQKVQDLVASSVGDAVGASLAELMVKVLELCFLSVSHGFSLLPALKSTSIHLAEAPVRAGDGVAVRPHCRRRIDLGKLDKLAHVAVEPRVVRGLKDDSELLAGLIKLGVTCRRTKIRTGESPALFYLRLHEGLPCRFRVLL